jgi:uncharacterized protein YdbL (DUF1318 family)
MFKSGDPQAMAQMMVNNNPQVAQILQQYNGDAKQAFYAIAQQNGVNPDEILNLLK